MVVFNAAMVNLETQFLVKQSNATANKVLQLSKRSLSAVTKVKIAPAKVMSSTVPQLSKTKLPILRKC